MKTNLQRKIRRKTRVSSNIRGTADRPRVSVFRSNKYIYGQVIDDVKSKTLASYSTLFFKKGATAGTKSDRARETGKKLAELLLKLKIQKVVFDRASYAYKGRVKQLAEGLREGKIQV